MTEPGYTRPCPIPGHPQDGPGDGTAMVPDSAWSRLRAWHLHAPAERLPVPVALLTWPAAWAMHAGHAPARTAGYATLAVAGCTWAVWMRRRRTGGDQDGRERFLPTEAALVVAAVGGWVTAAVTWGPLAGRAHLLTWAYLAGAAGGYAWLRRHQAIRAARARRDADAAWTARKAEWHALAPGIGLGDFDLQSVEPTYLGEEYLLTGSPYGDRASAIAANSSAITERWEHWLGLPYGSIDIDRTTHPGQLRVSIRHKDPGSGGTVRHPAINPESPYAGLFPAAAAVADPVPLLVEQETGEVSSVPLWVPGQGGQVIAIYARKGAGKTTILDDLRERVTAMRDAALVDANGAKVGDELAWEPLAAVTVAGSVKFDMPEGTTDKMLALLDWLQLLITQRTQTLAVTGDRVFPPTPEDPAVVAILDEIDEVVTIAGVSRTIEFIASKARQASVTLVIATQRATNQWTGGGGVKANFDLVLIGNMNRAAETRHATGAEHEIPDISDYSRGEPGFFQVWDPAAKRVRARGRAFDAGSIGEQRQHVISRRDPAARPALPGPAFAPADEEASTVEGSRVSESGMRARLADARSLLAGGGPPAAPPAPAATPAAAPPAAARPRTPPGVPADAMPVLMNLLAAPNGTSSAAAGLALGKHRETGRTYLNALCEAGIAELTGGGRGARYALVRGEPAAPAPRRYLTLAEHAEAVVNDLISDVTPEQRTVMEQVHEMIRRQRAGDSS